MKRCKVSESLKKKSDVAEFEGLSAPARSALVSAGYMNLRQASKANEAELSALHGFGPKGLKILKALLAKKGLKLAKA